MALINILVVAPNRALCSILLVLAFAFVANPGQMATKGGVAISPRGVKRLLLIH